MVICKKQDYECQTKCQTLSVCLFLAVCGKVLPIYKYAQSSYKEARYKNALIERDSL